MFRMLAKFFGIESLLPEPEPYRHPQPTPIRAPLAQPQEPMKVNESFIISTYLRFRCEYRPGDKMPDLRALNPKLRTWVTELNEEECLAFRHTLKVRHRPMLEILAGKYTIYGDRVPAGQQMAPWERPKPVQAPKPVEVDPAMGAMAKLIAKELYALQQGQGGLRRA